MQRSVVLTALGALFLATLLWSVDAWARAGGGGSSGSRGSRSFSAPARPDYQSVIAQPSGRPTVRISTIHPAALWLDERPDGGHRRLPAGWAAR